MKSRAAYVLGQLTDLRVYLPEAERGEAVAVHQVRVICRRLRVWLALLERSDRVEGLRAALDALRSGLGPLRDEQVQQGEANPVSHSRASRLAKVAVATWSRQHADAAEKLDHVLQRHLRSRASVERRLAARLENVEACIGGLGGALPPVTAHLARIELRKLRYGLELLEEPVPQKTRAALVSLQDALGALHDCDVAAQGGPVGKRPALRKARAALEHDATREIRAWKGEGHPERLAKRLGAP